MLKNLRNLFLGDYNTKQLKSLRPILSKIYERDEKYESLTDLEIKENTEKFKDRIQNKGESLDSILPEAFANVLQACKRMKGQSFDVKGNLQERNMVPYESQLIGGIVLHQGKIAEMKTGEGKTLVATLPAYLNALSGKGVHVVTVNDYLASRDSEWMGNLYKRLGLTVGTVTKTTNLTSRREAYGSDITYVENSELGFDYLRDNLAHANPQRNVLRRPLNYAIVDEADSIFVDEARTPLIISQPSDEATDKYESYAKIVKFLVPSQSKKKVSKGFLHELLSDEQADKEKIKSDGDYFIDEKTKTVSLTSDGIAKLEKILGVEHLYKDMGYQEIHHIENALKAQAVYIKDKDYIVGDNEILIVDEHTGRTMPGRRYSEGLHQAIEAKENVKIQNESKTIATITYQNFFRLYNKLSGMTGTAVTEAEEFEKIYNIGVILIPTHKPVIRVDHNDKVFFNQNAKRKAVLDAIKFSHNIGQPILIGTSSIATSEFMSELLRKQGLVHTVLNAKFHEQEANIVSQAGNLGSIVVATNMAGRGTDIKLAPGLNQQIAKKLIKRTSEQLKEDSYQKRPESAVRLNFFSEDEFNFAVEALKSDGNISNEQILQAEKEMITTDFGAIKIIFNKSKKLNTQIFASILIQPQKDFKGNTLSKDVHFGLFILGTEKHDSRRIDNQLRGRAGRQGDAGISQFYVSLDDEIMRKMGGERIQKIAAMLLSKDELESMELTQSQFTNSIERAQKQMEGRNFSIRKHLFEYDSVINKQRQRTYAKRDKLISMEDNEEFLIFAGTEIKSYIVEAVKQTISTFAISGSSREELINDVNKNLGIDLDKNTVEAAKSLDELEEIINKTINDKFDILLGFEERESVAGFIKQIMLQAIDNHWINHIDDMQYLREKVGLYGYAQLDPLMIYKKEAYEKFELLNANIHQEIIVNLLKANVPQNRDTQINMMPSEQPQIIKINTDGLQEYSQPTSYQANSDIEVIDISKSTHGPRVTREPDKKPRPNEECRCGSGKKYKKCHGA